MAVAFRRRRGFTCSQEKSWALRIWICILPLQKQQHLSAAELGSESWVRLPLTRCRSFQPCMSSKTATSRLASNAGSTSVGGPLCCAISCKMCLCYVREGWAYAIKRKIHQRTMLIFEYLLSSPQQPSVPIAIWYIVLTFFQKPLKTAPGSTCWLHNWITYNLMNFFRVRSSPHPLVLQPISAIWW